MMAVRTHGFVADGRRYLFDGYSLGICEVTDDTSSDARPAPLETGFDPSRGTYLRSVALNLINGCNLACTYCYADGGRYDSPGTVMSLETARRAVDMVIESVVRNGGDSVTIGFFGGEPLLASGLIDKIVAYTNASVPHGVAARYQITTNGTLLKPEHITLMEQNRFQVTVSIDGNAAAHNANRVHPDGRGSYDETVAAIQLLLASDVPLTARITLSDANPRVDESVAHIVALGVQRITYALDYGMSEAAFEQFMASLGRLFVDLRALIGEQRYIDVTNISEPITAIVLKKRKRAHCNAGVSYLSVSAEGEIYRCPRFTGNRRFALGSVAQQPQSTVGKRMLEFQATLKRDAGDRTLDCANCPFIYLCGGVCFHHAFSVSGAEFATVPRECVYRRQLFQNVLELLCKLDVSERRAYLLHLSRLWKERR